ncbi:MAG: hypothetical protein GX557_12550 [Chloroflexi bacterium]|nr:hypothetical protein [Chloroflexota bacterium]
MSIKAVVEGIVLVGLDDWVIASAVASTAMCADGAESRDEIRMSSLAALCILLTRGLVVIGDLDELPPSDIKERRLGFVPWRLSVEDALARVDREWRRIPGRFPRLYELFWLNNTDLGMKVGEELLASETGVSLAERIIQRGTREELLDAPTVSWLASWGLVTGWEIPNRERSLDAIGQLLSEGLVEIGSVAQSAGHATGDRSALEFRRWPIDVHSALARVDGEWRKREEQGRRLRELFWLRNTALGNELARSRS